jgi:Helix-turn-helix.
MTITELLDIAKDLTGSDNLTAKRIGVTSAVISNWRTGKREPTNRQCLELATLIGVHWSMVVKASEIAAAIRRNEPEQAARWERVSTIQSWAAALLFISVIVWPQAGETKTYQRLSVEQPEYTLSVYATPPVVESGGRASWKVLHRLMADARASAVRNVRRCASCGSRNAAGRGEHFGIAGRLIFVTASSASRVAAADNRHLKPCRLTPAASPADLRP